MTPKMTPKMGAAEPGFGPEHGLHTDRGHELLAERESLAGVIIDGDCAYLDGQPGDYATLTKILAPLSEVDLPVHFTLGNHDDREQFYEVCRKDPASSPVASKHCSVLETPVADWILLDSLRYVNQVEGEIGREQMEWLAERLRENPDKPAIVVGHHYPQVFRTDVIPADEEIKISGLVDSEALLDTLIGAPAAKAYVYGHSHNWRLERDESGLHQVNLPPTAYVFDPERPSSWVRATVRPGGVELELRSLDPDHPQHGERRELAWRA